MQQLKVGLVGCGAIGKRRAREVAHHPATVLTSVADIDAAAANAVAAEFACGAARSWQALVADPAIDVAIVSTPNGYLREIACAALRSGKHVLLEKPMGRNVEEARSIARAASESGRLVKVGFNHRYHPAIRGAWERYAAGELGTLINARIRYGHGGRPGYENEWRGNLDLAGGGELTDQGVHALDLLNWFAGRPTEAFAMTQTAAWPIGPLEDNGFALLRFPRGAIASVHTSWTQWKNLFSLELFCTNGTLIAEGLGRSYGTETLQIHRRALEGGAPSLETLTFDGPDDSWKREWFDFVRAIEQAAFYDGGPEEGIAVMEMLEALYASARTAQVVRL